MSDTIATRVARGVALLDEKLPGWADRIDLDKLDLGSACNCVLGQEFAGHPDDGWSTPFDLATDALFPDDTWGANVVAFGFDSSHTTQDPYEPLTAEWKRVILARRGGGAR